MRHVLPGVLVCAACSEPPPTFHPAPSVEVAAFRATPLHDLDLLFVVDDSPSAAGLSRAGDYVASLYDVFSTLDPPVFDLHAGVVTADLGTTGSLDPAHPAPAIGACASAGDDGALRAPYLQVTVTGDGNLTTNAEGSVLTALSRSLATGSAGCQLQQPARAIYRGLTSPTNAGFLRSTAALGIVMLATEDDCSVRDAAIFDPTQLALGAAPPFRCTTEGIRCDQPLDSTGDKTGCVARDDSAYIASVSPFARFLVDMKGDPRALMVAAIAGPPAPVHVGADAGGLVLSPACSYTDVSGVVHGAAPAVRDAALLAALPPQASVTSVAPCTDDLSPAFTQVARALKRTLGDPCIDTTGLHDDDQLAPGIQPYCGVDDVRDSAPDEPVVVPRCPVASGDCFDLLTDPRVCPYTPDHLRVEVTRAAAPPSDAWTHVHCSLAP